MKFKVPEAQKIQNIIKLVDEAHLEDVMRVLGKENYRFLLDLCKDRTEVAQLFLLTDLLLNSSPPKQEIEFNEVGMRIESNDRTLDTTIGEHHYHYIYNLVKEQTAGLDFIRPILTQLYLGMGAQNTQEENEEYFSQEVFTFLEEDITNYLAATTYSRERKDLILYFNMLNELDSPVTTYIIHRNLRSSGATIKGLYEGTWEDEITE